MKSFFMFESNHSVQGRSNRYKGLHPTSVRDHICFFSVMSLVNSNDVYIKE